MPKASKSAPKHYKKASHSAGPLPSGQSKIAVDRCSIPSTTAASSAKGSGMSEAASSSGSNNQKTKGRGKASRIPLEPSALLKHEGYDEVQEWLVQAMQKMAQPPLCILNPSPADAKDIDAASRELVTELNKKYKLLTVMDGRMTKRQSTPKESLDTLRALKSHLRRASALLHDLLKKELDTSRAMGCINELATAGYHFGLAHAAKITKQFSKECVQHGKWDALKTHIKDFLGQCAAKGHDAAAMQKFAEGILDMGFIKLVSALTGDLAYGMLTYAAYAYTRASFVSGVFSTSNPKAIAA